jgi:tetratricopeptide (TPR) repeat protein
LLWPGAGVHAHGTFHDRLAAASDRIAAHPDDALLYLARADLYRDHGDFAQAMEDIDRAEALDAQLPAARLVRAHVLQDSGRLEEADAVLSRVLARSPEQGEALGMRAAVRLALGRNLEAARDYDRAIAQQAVAKPDLYLMRSRALAAAGDEHLAEAIEGLDTGIARMGPVATLERAALELELRRGTTDAALERLDGMTARSPRKDPLLAWRGRILEAAGRSAEARRSYQQALDALSELPASRRHTTASRDLERQLHEALERLPESKVGGGRG